MDQLLMGIIIAFFASFFTVILSPYKFRTERWWEKKAEFYTKIIEHLYSMKALAENYIKANQNESILQKEDEEILSRKKKEAKEELMKIINSGTFIISKDSSVRLKTFMRDFNQPATYSWIDDILNEIDLCDNCIDDIIVLGKKDLDIYKLAYLIDKYSKNLID